MRAKKQPAATLVLAAKLEKRQRSKDLVHHCTSEQRAMNRIYKAWVWARLDFRYGNGRWYPVIIPGKADGKPIYDNARY